MNKIWHIINNLEFIWIFIYYNIYKQNRNCRTTNLNSYLKFYDWKFPSFLSILIWHAEVLQTAKNIKKYKIHPYDLV